MLDWSMLDLAKAANVSISTVKRMELVGPQPLSDNIQMTVQAALEAAGVSFLTDLGEGAGLRFQPR